MLKITFDAQVLRQTILDMYDKPDNAGQHGTYFICINGKYFLTSAPRYDERVQIVINRLSPISVENENKEQEFYHTTSHSDWGRLFKELYGDTVTLSFMNERSPLPSYYNPGVPVRDQGVKTNHPRIANMTSYDAMRLDWEGGDQVVSIADMEQWGGNALLYKTFKQAGIDLQSPEQTTQS